MEPRNVVVDELGLTLALLSALLLILVSGFVAHIRQQRRIEPLRDENTRLKVELEAERRAGREKLAAFEQARHQLTATFQAIAGDALKSNSSEFLKLAQENLGRFQAQAQGQLAEREQAVEALVKPIRETLDKTEQQIRQMEKERQNAFGSLSKHLETMADLQRHLSGETRNLVQALRRPEVRGQWGEMTLKRLAELAGMVEYCDFYEQVNTRDGEGSLLRPDMIVRLPDSRDIIVDAKTPLDAYLHAVEAKDDVTRDRHLQHHAKKVRERVRELAAKQYWQQFEHAPDFVILFIPGEQFLSAALEVDRNLLEDALKQKIILATPTSFVALLRAVAYGWRQDALTRNAEHIRHVGEDLYNRLLTYTEHLARLGKSLDSSVNHFNKAVASFDSRVLPGARKFIEMGIGTSKELEESTQIERSVRALADE